MAANPSPTSCDDENDDKPRKVNCVKVDVGLLPYKGFYFLFYFACGSMFPYLAIFYKQLRLSAQQTGILIGMRPLLKVIGSPVWGLIADKSNKSKLIFLLSIVAGLILNSSLLLVHRRMNTWPCRDNETLTMLDDAHRTTAENIKNRTTDIITGKSKTIMVHMTSEAHQSESERSTRSLLVLMQSKAQSRKSGGTIKTDIERTVAELEKNKMARKINELNALGHSPWSLHFPNFQDQITSKTSNYQENGVFLLLLFITLVSTILSSPTIPFADTATLQSLGDDKDSYGKQRQWGALGFGLSSFAVGSVASTMQEKYNCNVPHHMDYTPCFYAFAILMITALIPAFLFRFEDRNKSNVTVDGAIKSLLNLECLTFLVTVLLLGCSWGLIYSSFLLWHLDELGGTQFLFNHIILIQCFSEVVSFYLADQFIQIFGHHRLLYLSLLFSSLRFVFYGVIENPWFVLPIESFHGVSTALVWSVTVSFVSLKANVITTVYGLLYGLQMGLGVGGGAIFGGFLVNCIGSRKTFIIFGIILFVNLLVLLTIRNSKFACSKLGKLRI